MEHDGFEVGTHGMLDCHACVRGGFVEEVVTCALDWRSIGMCLVD